MPLGRRKLPKITGAAQVSFTLYSNAAVVEPASSAAGDGPMDVDGRPSPSPSASTPLDAARPSVAPITTTAPATGYLYVCVLRVTCVAG